MVKRLILAVAGSGKTSQIIEELDLDRKFLIITYTNCNFSNIRSRIIKKFGYHPENIKAFTYFSFLYSFCFKPFLLKELGTKGINFEACRNRYASGDSRYIDSSQRVYSNRLAKLLDVKGVIDGIIDRLNKYFDVVMIDEVQDLSGHDFNLLPHIVRSNNDIIFVGDFYQHTFDTSKDGSVNKNLHNDYESYIQRFVDMGLTIDDYTLSDSYRCSPSICEYISTNLGIAIGSHREDGTDIQLVSSEEGIHCLFQDNDVIKLFYQESYKHPCYSNNWGNSKGEDHYSDVCVVLNQKTFKLFSEDCLNELIPQTKNKLYVAITRARGHLYFIEEKILKKLSG